MKLGENLYSNSDKIICGENILITFFGLEKYSKVDMYYRYIDKNNKKEKFKKIECNKNKLGAFSEIIPEDKENLEIYFEINGFKKIKKDKNGKKYIFNLEKRDVLEKENIQKLPQKENRVLSFLKNVKTKVINIIKYIPKYFNENFDLVI